MWKTGVLGKHRVPILFPLCNNEMTATLPTALRPRDIFLHATDAHQLFREAKEDEGKCILVGLCRGLDADTLSSTARIILCEKADGEN